VASAAIAAASKVAGWAGMSSGGGSSSGMAGSVGGGFGRGDQVGATTVIIQTIDPTSREVVNEVGYQLQRSGVLKTPLTPSSGTSGYPSVMAA
jgi:hypothetical protein